MIPRGLKSEDVVRAFEKAGGIKRQGKGSHINIKMPNSQLITIPGHGDVKVGLLQTAIRKSGIPVDQFLNFLRR